MTSADRLGRIRDVFQTALTLPPEQRDEYVRTACDDDGSMQVEVLCLLQLDRSSLTPFDTPIVRLEEMDEQRSSKLARAETMVGCVIGGCRITRFIGAGGMGLVYEAEQLSTGRSVAVKFLDDLRMSKQLLWRFKREIAVLSKFDHPGIARLYDAGFQHNDDLDRPYFVMEYVRGSQSIVEYATEQSMSEEQRLTLFCEVCDAVASGHQRGIVHRDLKPGNILINDEGHPKVIDFGVAGALEGNELGIEATIHKEHLVGSLHTIAPEQFDAGRSVPDIRSDVYSLGVVLFELLTGTPPIEVKSTSLLAAAREILDATPARASSLDDTLRGDVDSICAMALAKDPDARYQSALDLAEDIQRYLHGQPVRARSAERWYRFRCAVRQYRIPAILTLVVLIVMTSAMLTYRSLYTTTNTQKRQLELQSHDLNRSNYMNLIALAESALNNDNIIEARTLLEQCPIELRSWEWSYLHGRLDGAINTVSCSIAVTMGRLSSDGRRLVAARKDRKSAAVIDLETGDPLWSRSFGSDIIDKLAWSDDGAAVAICRRSTSSLIVDAVTGDKLLDLEGVIAVEDGFALTGPFACGTALTVHLWPSRSGGTSRELFTLPSALTVLRSDSGGQFLAVGCHDGTVLVYDIQNEEIVMQVRAHTTFCSHIRFTDDSRYLVTSGWDGHVNVWHIETAQRLRTLTPAAAYRPCIQLSDSNGILAYSSRGTIVLCDFKSGDEIIRLHGLESSISHIQLNIDEQTVTAVNDSQIKTWDLTQTGSFALRPSEHTDWIDCIAFAQTGDWLATYGREGTLLLRDTASYAVAAKAVTSSSRMIWLGFSPDDEYVVGRTVDGRLHVWTVPDLEFVISHDLHRGGIAYADWWNDRTLLTPGPGSEVIAISIRDGQILNRLDTTQRELRAITLSRDKSYLVTASINPGKGSPGLIVWRAGTDGFEKAYELLSSAGVASAMCSEINDSFISGGMDGIVRKWDLHTGKNQAELNGHQEYVHSVQFLDDDRRIVSSEYPGGIRVWDTGTGRLLLDLPAGGSRFDIHPDTEAIVSDHSPSLAFHCPGVISSN